jgi:RimJ/RimL family protein N-acetyltransferase
MNKDDPGTIPPGKSRVDLRPFCLADEEMYCGLYTNPESMRYIAPPLSAKDAASRFRRILACPPESSPPQYFAILEKDSLDVVGFGAIQAIDPVSRSVELGMMLVARAQSRGHATEGLSILVHIAFETLPIDTVWVQYGPEHKAAERLVIRVGFEEGAGAGIGRTVTGTRIWSMARSSWHSRCTNDNRGGGNVKDNCIS